MDKLPQNIGRHLWMLTGFLAVLLFAETYLPYWYAQQQAGADVFLGQLAYTPDQNMYFSFISQARDGQFLLYNKLTAMPNQPAFVNLEWWLAGFIQRVLGLSENGAYQVWRFLGILLLTGGFLFMARSVLPSVRRITAATLAAMLTGGFGFLFAILSAVHIIGQSATQNGIIDMRYGLLPLQQMLTNPHFSFPHGLILFAYGLYLRGLNSSSVRLYTLSGLMFTVIGLVRPYDIIPPFVIFPLHLLITGALRQFRVRNMALQLLPLVMLAPVLLYNVWLFKFNDAFKEWSTQGLNATAMPAPLWHFMAYGILGVLAALRIAQVKRKPLNRSEKFLLLWFGVTFALIQLGRYIPAIGWSPQIGVYLAVPLALLGFNVEVSFLNTRRKKTAAITALAAIMLISNASIILYYMKNFRDGGKRPIYYATANEMAAFNWLKGHAKKNEVVLALPVASQRIAKYTQASVVAAHYSVTPKFTASAALAASLIRSGDALALRSANIAYVYVGTEERGTAAPALASLPVLYKNPDITIYGVSR